MKRPHLGARLPQPAPVATRRADRAERVVQHAHAHTGARPLRERVREAAARRIVADDVILEVDGDASRGDRRKHDIERARAVGVVLQAVAADPPGPRRAGGRPAPPRRRPRRAPADLLPGPAPPPAGAPPPTAGPPPPPRA